MEGSLLTSHCLASQLHFTKLQSRLCHTFALSYSGALLPVGHIPSNIAFRWDPETCPRLCLSLHLWHLPLHCLYSCLSSHPNCWLLLTFKYSAQRPHLCGYFMISYLPYWPFHVTPTATYLCTALATPWVIGRMHDEFISESSEPNSVLDMFQHI